MFSLRNVLNCYLPPIFTINNKVIEFYKGLGYNDYYEFIAYPNRKMYKMIKDLLE